MVASNGVKWEDAQYQELIPPMSRGIIATPADYAVIVEEKRAANKLLPAKSSDTFWKEQNGGVILLFVISSQMLETAT